MPVTLHYSTFQPAKPKPIRVRYKHTLEELLRRAAASVDRKGKALDLGRFNPLPQGRRLTRGEKISGLVLATAFSLAVWICAQPDPVSAHTGYFQSLAMSGGREAPSAQAFLESAVLAFGKEWKAPVLFAHVHPLFWHQEWARDPNEVTRRVEAGLAGLAGHGPVISATVFGTPTLGTMDRADGTAAVTGRITGQAELADGTVVRLAALLIQDEQTKQWGVVELSLPPFLP
jgi:hypothetical protein